MCYEPVCLEIDGDTSPEVLKGDTPPEEAKPPETKKPKVVKRPSGAGSGVKVVYRRHPMAKSCTYILWNKVFMVGISQKENSNHAALIEMVAKEIENGDFKEKAEVVARAKALARDDKGLDAPDGLGGPA